MINFTLLRRCGIRLLCLIATVLALSQSANAYNDCYIVDNFERAGGNGVSEWKTWNTEAKLYKVDTNLWSFEFTPTIVGDVFFRFRLDGDRFWPNTENTDLPIGTEATTSNAKKQKTIRLFL